jgi:hypothetical protein
LVKVKGTLEEVTGIKVIKINKMEKCNLDSSDDEKKFTNSSMQHCNSQKNINKKNCGF